MRSRGLVLAVVLLLAGCTSTVAGSPMPRATGSPTSGATGSPTPGASASPTPGATGSTLTAALSRMPAAGLGTDGYFEFGDSARLRQLAGTDAALWRFQENTGASALSTYATYTVATIGVDLSTAGSALTVGQAPRTMIVIAGGQDPAKIAAAATKSGWTGGEVLSRKLDISKGSSAAVGISLVAPKIRPIGPDVVLSQAGGDPTGVAAIDGTATPSAAALPGVKAAINCLGDVPSATGADLASADASDWTAVGAGAGAAGTASSVICLGSPDTATANSLAATVRSALDTGRSKRSGQPWRELLQSAEVDVLPGTPTMVRVTAGTATAVLGLQLLTGRDIPGR